MYVEHNEYISYWHLQNKHIHISHSYASGKKMIICLCSELPGSGISHETKPTKGQKEDQIQSCGRHQKDSQVFRWVLVKPVLSCLSLLLQHKRKPLARDAFEGNPGSLMTLRGFFQQPWRLKVTCCYYRTQRSYFQFPCSLFFSPQSLLLTLHNS